MRLTRRAIRSNAAAKRRCGFAIEPVLPGFTELRARQAQHPALAVRTSRLGRLVDAADARQRKEPPYLPPSHYRRPNNFRHRFAGRRSTDSVFYGHLSRT
jgi:hypothetical protein